MLKLIWIWGQELSYGFQRHPQNISCLALNQPKFAYYEGRCMPMLCHASNLLKNEIFRPLIFRDDIKETSPLNEILSHQHSASDRLDEGNSCSTCLSIANKTISVTFQPQSQQHHKMIPDCCAYWWSNSNALHEYPICYHERKTIWIPNAEQHQNLHLNFTFCPIWTEPLVCVYDFHSGSLRFERIAAIFGREMVFVAIHSHWPVHFPWMQRAHRNGRRGRMEYCITKCWWRNIWIDSLRSKEKISMRKVWGFRLCLKSFGFIKYSISSSKHLPDSLKNNWGIINPTWSAWIETDSGEVWSKLTENLKRVTMSFTQSIQ